MKCDNEKCQNNTNVRCPGAGSRGLPLLWIVSMFAVLCLLGCENIENIDEMEVDKVESAVVSGTTVSSITLERTFSNAIVKLDTSRGYCSGLLIAPRLVLTAGHCAGNCSWDTPVNANRAEAFIGADSKSPIERIPVISQWDITGDPDTSWVHDAGWPGRFSVDNTSCSLFGHTDLGLWELAYPPRKALPYWDEDKVRAAFENIAEDDWGTIYGFGEAIQGHNGLLQRGVGQVSKEPFWDFNPTTGKYGVRLQMTFQNGTRPESGDSGGPIFSNSLIPMAVIANSNTEWLSGPTAGAHLDWIEGMVERLDEELLYGDFNGDGLDDVLHTNRNNEGDWVDIYVGRERPASPVIPSQLMTWCKESNLAIGDINGDGKDDLACPGTAASIDGKWSAEVLSVFFATSDSLGLFTGFESAPAVFALPEKCGMALLGQFDGAGPDGKRNADLLCQTTLSAFSSKMRVYKNTGDMRRPYGIESSWYQNGWCRGAALHVGDFDGDRSDDLLCDKISSGRIEVKYSRPYAATSHIFGFESTKSVETTWCKTGQLLIGHLNPDAASDLACWKPGVNPFYNISNRSRESVPFNFSPFVVSRLDGSGFCSKSTQEVSLLDLSDVSRSASLVCYDHENGQTTIAPSDYNIENGAVVFHLSSATRMPDLAEKL